MEAGQSSRTAEVAAAIRAAHMIYDPPPLVFEDPYAIHLTSATWRTVARHRLLYWLVARKILGPLRSVHGQVLGRSRYAEEQLEKAFASGISQYILMGAGLDSFALRRRDLATSLKVLELDHPATQTIKRRRLARLTADLPHNLEFVTVDFEHETVADALARSSFARAKPAFLSWLGTTPYLSRDAVFATLRAVAAFVPPGSQIVFDYLIPDELAADEEKQTIEEHRRFVERLGEPLMARLDPRTLPAEVCELGFELIGNLSPEVQRTKYFAKRQDDLRPFATAYFAHFQVR